MAKRSNRNSDVLIQNSIKTLLANIRFSSVDGPVRSIAITSAVPNEGKTTIAIYLAEAIASSGKSVLLVECDMRRRSVAKKINVRGSLGVYSVLSGQSGLEDAVVATRTPNMYFLDAEPGIPNPADILSSGRFKQFIAQAEQVYDCVVIDTPPVGTFVDAAVISSVVEDTVLVVRQDFSKRNEILDACDQLKKAGAHLVGTVLNCCEMKSNDYYYDYYSKKSASHTAVPAVTSNSVSPYSSASSEVRKGTRFRS